MTLRAPPPQFPLALEDDPDDVAWALRTAGVQWNMGAQGDAIEWLLRAVDTSIDAGRIERARDIQRNINDLSEAVRQASQSPPKAESRRPSSLSQAPLRPKTSSLPPLPPPPGFEEMEADTLDVDVDVELEEVESLSADGDGIEVLEPEVLDEITAEDELSADELETFSEATLEVAAESIRPDEPRYPASEAPTAQTDALPRYELSLPEPELEDPQTLPPPEAVFPSLAASLAAAGAPSSARGSAEGSVQNSAREVAISSVPESEPPRREPWRPSPSFGDLAPPPPSVVFRSASSAPAVEPGDERASDPPPEFVAEAPNLAPPPSVAPSPPTPRASPAPPPLPLPSEPAPARVAPSEPALAGVGARAPSSVPAGPASIFGLELAEIHGLEDLPDDAQHELARSVEIHLIDAEEEVTGFGLALVLEGRVAIMPAVMDVVCQSAGRGELIFGEGHVGEGVALKVVAAEDQTRLATWPIEQFAAAIAPCPWVRDELRRVGDKLQALAGAAMGPMGEKLDEQLRAMVLERCSVKLLLPGEVVVEAGKPSSGMTIVGAGRLELLDREGRQQPGDLGPGDFVFPSEMLRAAPVPATVRAGHAGALVIFADRKTAHELMMSVPPLIEVLSD